MPSLWPSGSLLRNPIWMQCMHFADNAGWPVTFHVTEPVGHDYPDRVSTPFEDFLLACTKNSNPKSILAHTPVVFFLL